LIKRTFILRGPKKCKSANKYILSNSHFRAFKFNFLDFKGDFFDSKLIFFDLKVEKVEFKVGFFDFELDFFDFELDFFDFELDFFELKGVLTTAKSDRNKMEGGGNKLRRPKKAVVIGKSDDNGNKPDV
jgi:hypothetical protein